MWRRYPLSTQCLLGIPSPTRIYKNPLRLIHSTHRAKYVNPFLPFDVLEELENDEVKDTNKKLKKQKKKLLKQREDMRGQLDEGKDSDKKGDRVSKEQSDKCGEPHITNIEKLGVEQNIYGTNPKGEANSNLNSSRDIRQNQGGEGGGGGSGNGPSKPHDENEDKMNNRVKEEKEKEKEKEEEEEQEQEDEFEEEEKKSNLRETFEKIGRFVFKCLETIGITLSSVGVLGLSGFLYHRVYNAHVLDKMDQAFEQGDPAYQLAIHKKTNKRSNEDEEEQNERKEGDKNRPTRKDCEEDLAKFWVTRPQQKLLDDIINGKIRGRYFLLVGEKGTGKTTLIMEAMKKINGNNVTIFDAHADPEIFRIRLGRALNFAFNEDYIGSLFSIRGPRDTTALLDIERAFNKLEELAIKRKILGKSDRPLIMIINNSHLIKENEEGVKLLELLQQKAESLSGSELVTIIFNSDDYWVYEKLKRLGTRLELINVRDFNRLETVNVLKFVRGKFYPPDKHPDLMLSDRVCNTIYDLIGGRPQHISQVARHVDVIKACHEIIDREKTWFLNQCGLLGQEMDDDVMESGKFSSSAMLLMREFVEMDRLRANSLICKELPDDKDSQKDHHLPELPLWRSRQIMTRADYIQQYDNLNIFTVDSDSRVRADSVPMMRAFHEIASQPNFDALLDESIERVAAIESLGRTREIVMKDLTEGSTYDVSKKDGKFILEMVKKDEEDNEGNDIFMEEISKSDHKRKWWAKRMGRQEERDLRKKQ